MYGIEVYANTFKSYLNPLIIKCNCLLRLLQNESRMCKVINLYKTYNTLPVDSLFKLYTMKLLHRCLYDQGNVPEVIVNLFTYSNAVHSHNTRSKLTFHLPGRMCNNAVTFTVPSMWYKLPSQLRDNSVLNSFIADYKLFLFQQQ